MTNTFVPNSLYQEVRMIIMSLRQRVKHLQKTSELKHSACWDDVQETPDPDCTVCGGSGYLMTAGARFPSAVITPKVPHGFQGGAGSLHSVAGKQERVDAEMWMDGESGEDVKMDDLIVFPYDQGHTNVEYTVITKIPFVVFGNKPFAYKFMLFKSIRPEFLTSETKVP